MQNALLKPNSKRQKKIAGCCVLLIVLLLVAAKNDCSQPLLCYFYDIDFEIGPDITNPIIFDFEFEESHATSYLSTDNDIKSFEYEHMRYFTRWTSDDMYKARIYMKYWEEVDRTCGICYTITQPITTSSLEELQSIQIVKPPLPNFKEFYKSE